MATRRITQSDLNNAFERLVGALLKRSDLSTDEVTLIRGNYAHGVTNKLVIRGENLWPDGMAGHTTRDAYEACRLMRSALLFDPPVKR